MIDLEKLDVEAPVGDFSTYDSEITIPFVEAIPEGGVYLEVGVNRGKSLYIARKVSKPSVKVYGVDLRQDPKVKGTIFWQQDSKLGSPEPIKIDVLFIDGDHTYEGCKADIEVWSPLVKDGGVILFHDADEGGTGILRAITEWVETGGRAQKWNMYKRTDKNTSVVSIQL